MILFGNYATEPVKVKATTGITRRRRAKARGISFGELQKIKILKGEELL